MSRVEMDLKGKRFLVTGSSRGIGRAVVEQLLAAGARVVMNSTDEESLREVAKEVGAMAVCGDVGVEEDVVRMVGEAVELLGGLDGLVNNAGIGARAGVLEIEAQAFRRVLDVNVVGAALVARECLPHLKRTGEGDIVNISSTSGLRGGAGGSIYTSSKFALRGMTECWRAELRPHDIRVVLVNPSEVQTGFGGRVIEKINPDKLVADDIAAVVIDTLRLHRRAMVPEVTVFATNPFRSEDERA